MSGSGSGSGSGSEALALQLYLSEEAYGSITADRRCLNHPLFMPLQIDATNHELSGRKSDRHQRQFLARKTVVDSHALQQRARYVDVSLDGLDAAS